MRKILILIITLISFGLCSSFTTNHISVVNHASSTKCGMAWWEIENLTSTNISLVEVYDLYYPNSNAISETNISGNSTRQPNGYTLSTYSNVIFVTLTGRHTSGSIKVTNYDGTVVLDCVNVTHTSTFTYELSVPYTSLYCGTFKIVYSSSSC